MKFFYFFILPYLIFCQETSLPLKIAGDVGTEVENVVEAVTQNPNLINFPTIDINSFIQSLPTLPPLVLPTIDPNFWKNLPTLPPLVFPTLDPNFLNNLPTLPPLNLPTLDPNFWSNLPTLPPLVLPTLDPNLWNNLPTLPPFVLPTLDPNFWTNLIPSIDSNFLNNLPTLPPLPTFPPLVFPTPTPKTSQCFYKLSQYLANNQTFANLIDYSNVQGVVTDIQFLATTICSQDQSQKINNLVTKYSSLINDTQQITPYLTTDDEKNLLSAILDNNSGSTFQLFLTKSLNYLTNATASSQLTKVSTQISMLQFDLLLNPI